MAKDARVPQASDGLTHPPEAAAESNLPCQLPSPPSFRDTAFTENHEVALHRWVPWIAGFSGSFVAGVLDTVRQRGKMRVLDPFAGVGTTLIEALKKGDDTIGFEINPYAALACKVKANAGHYDVALLDDLIARFESYGAAQSWLHARPASARPAGFRSRSPFFSDAVERQVLACLDFIGAAPSPAGRGRGVRADWLKDLLRVAFGSVMVSFSNYTYEPSLGTRAGAGKPDIDDADVFDIVGRKLQEMRDDIVRFQGWLARHNPVPRATVHPLSYLDHAHRIKPRSIDVLITSPPYLNNYHYIRNTRPHLFWLGLAQAPADLKAIERQSFGLFWQTVRSGPPVALRPDLPHLAEQIEQLRALHPEKGPYGGSGWANYAAAYFNDCQRFCAVTRSRMRPGGTAVVVIGNNILQGIEFQTDRLFAEIAEREGFKIVKLHEVRKRRTGNSIINSSVRIGSARQRVRLYETAVELRAP